jgi:hypothetical protein
VEAFFWGINALADCFTLINDFDFDLLFVLLLVLARFLVPFLVAGFTAVLDGVLTVVFEGTLTTVFGVIFGLVTGAIFGFVIGEIFGLAITEVLEVFKVAGLTAVTLTALRLVVSSFTSTAIVESTLGKSLAEN